ncbi:D-Tyr tRNAtyr deacylase-like domain-containing protein [Lipomyces tetrasporus]|uniref:D-aminoacyl-tRNA deacylase n=1 Tax=Lipomyces tetrasporus TaxID=54092 RepID=A0AAD7VVC3_9ASCO|nr:D-Tyr tRNAtyr deacylase-like domain-containing protein [Lipomyces tetrasporus]KAJ8102819.1 D-Tyr tRNAtyr deacylase-like domain-containing protein [Lipomyces tetrasporus]
MRAVVQRVRSASVSVDGSVVSAINRGLVVLVGVEIGDTISDCDILASKIANLRIFALPASGSVTPSESESAASSGASTPSADGGERTRLDKQWDKSVVSVDGEILCISQFTLLASVKKNKPSFHHAERPAVANELYERVMYKMRSAFGEGKDNKVKSGVFGAYMQVSLVNDGPVTIQLTSQ